MTAPSEQWFETFPGPNIPDVLRYVGDTWSWLAATHSQAVAFHHNETVLTDNLCEALNDARRKRDRHLACDFQPETWELRRNGQGEVKRVARADIRVMLGAPGTPHLVLEFKKLDGGANARWRYCFDGVNRFVEGKYAGGHLYGVMCGFSPNDLAAEATALADYLSSTSSVAKLQCLANGSGTVATLPSAVDPAGARFDTRHGRVQEPSSPITLLHALLPAPSAAAPLKPILGGEPKA